MSKSCNLVGICLAIIFSFQIGKYTFIADSGFGVFVIEGEYESDGNGAGEVPAQSPLKDGVIRLIIG